MRDRLTATQKRDMAENDWPRWLEYIEKKYHRPLTIRFVSAESIEKELSRQRIGLSNVIWMGKDVE